MCNYNEMKNLIQAIHVTKNSNLDDFASLKIGHDKNIDVYYCPFDYINTDAKIVLVGITPGKQQFINALLSAKDAIAQNLTTPEILKKVKIEGAFSGPLRNNLVKLMDNIGLNKKLGIASSKSLFEEHRHLLHTTSILQQPTFVNNKDYNGSSPKMLKTPIMLKQIENFKKEIERLPNALYIPLGNKVSEIFEIFINDNILNENQVLIGLPHPSGANAGRISYFLGDKTKESLPKNSTINAENLDLAKHEILMKLDKTTI